MEKPVPVIEELYGNRVRVRVCGIWITNDRILLINHAIYQGESEFWSPPGGGIEFGESSIAALEREFVEETGQAPKVGDLLFVNEFIKPPLHAIELFYKIEALGEGITLGQDPELDSDHQIIKNLRYFSIGELKLLPQNSLHASLLNLQNFEQLYSRR